MKLYADTLTLPGSLLQGENPQPRFRAAHVDAACVEDGTLRPLEREGYGVGCTERTLPYRMQDRYTRSENLIDLETIIMENEHLKATFLPAYGGKLWSLFDKDNERELLFVNPVFRPANLANRNAWTAGGIEWNLGHTGHFAFTCESLYCVKMQSEDGETFLRMYEYEATHAQVLQMDFHLPDGAKQLAMHVRIENARSTSAPLYWWTNTAVRLTPHTRVFSGTADILYQLTPDPDTRIPGFGLTQMPEQPNLKGVDVSYPWRIPHSIEYFFQNSRSEVSPWEVSIEADCTGFAERSTQPLFARKMFCWGSSVGGHHWCDYLSKKGQGDYIEIQAGIAPTQLHTCTLCGNGIVAFTQLFGAFEAPSQAQTAPWGEALPLVAQAVEETLSAETVLKLHSKYAAKACLPGGEMLHCGGFYGGLERARRLKTRETSFAEHLAFLLPPPESAFYPWYALLQGAPLPDTSVPLPYVTDAAWMQIVKALLEETGGNEQSWFQYGVQLAENGQEKQAVACFKKLVQEHQNPWAAHALGALAKRGGDFQQASDWFVLAQTWESNSLDASFAEDAMEALLKIEQYEKAWAIFTSIPAERKSETEHLLAAEAAVKLENFAFLEQAFEKEYASIREGAVGLADVWLEYKARRACKEKGIAFTREAIDTTLPLPQKLNFRMFDD